MSIHRRHNIHVMGRGDTDMIFAHGFGCDQNMWRLITPAFVDRYRVILYDLVGSGRSDLAAYDRAKYGTLEGHARDVGHCPHLSAPDAIVSAMRGFLDA